MKSRLFFRCFFFLWVFGHASQAFGQGFLFDSEEVLKLKIAGNLSPVLSDTSIFPVYFSQQLSFYDPVSQKKVDLDIELKARGNFRRLKAGCTHLPLMLRFPDSLKVTGTVFRNQRKLKLVLPCQGVDYVYREQLAYQIYNLINPDYSFKTRRISIDFIDNKTNKSETNIQGFIIENDKKLAARNNMYLEEEIVSATGIKDDDYLKMVLFQFLIGNTDWSIPFLHNMKVIRKDSISEPIAIPYDFDHAGIVNAPYAISPPPLELTSVRQRLYRGYCMDDIARFKEAISHFNKTKEKIYQLAENTPWLDFSTFSEVQAYLDEFYTIINDTDKRKAALLTPCLPDSKANIVIMGIGY